MLECPASYFGKGENHNLSDDSAEELREFEQKFREWEEKHPNDPTGEKALAIWKVTNPTGSKVATPKTPEPITAPTEEEEDDSEKGSLKLVLSERQIQKIKGYARVRGCRPRDLVIEWIEKFCKL